MTVASEQLEPGDSVLFYTDGVTEAHVPGGEEFGTERLADPPGARIGSTRACGNLFGISCVAVLDYKPIDSTTTPLWCSSAGMGCLHPTSIGRPEEHQRRMRLRQSKLSRSDRPIGLVFTESGVRQFRRYGMPRRCIRRERRLADQAHWSRGRCCVVEVGPSNSTVIEFHVCCHKSGRERV